MEPSATNGVFIAPPCLEAPHVLFVDEHLAVVDKPSGLLSVPGRHPANKDSLISRLQADWPDALIVHRLDMDTSGIMVIARSKAVHAQLSNQFQQRQISKTYLATVAGHPTADSGSIDYPLIADWPNRPLQKICTLSGKPALTHYRVTERKSGIFATSTLELQPITGRSHQLRVHLMAIGHPILGDRFYAPSEVQSAASRLMLHASTLEFTHPATDERMLFTSPRNLDMPGT